MEREVPLADIEALISSYINPGKKPIDLASFPWVQERLSIFSRFLGFFGGKGVSWQEKYLFPILAETSLPYLQQFKEGSWKVYQEAKLKALFDFFSSRIDACRKFLPPELITFLMGPTPSFFQEKARAQAHCKGGICQWRRDEAYLEYKNRLQGLLGQAKPLKAPKPKTYPEETVAPLTKKTKERLDKTLEQLHKIRDECVECSFQVERDFSKLFPLRFEFESLVIDLQERKEALFSLLLNIEGEIAKLTEMHVIAEEDQAFCLLEKENHLLQEFSSKAEGMKKGLVKCRSQAQEARTSLYRCMQDLIRMIDSVAVLPKTSSFWPHQERILRMAHEKVKKFKESLSGGPGPGFSFSILEIEVNHFIDLAKQFLEEGVGVDKMRDQLSSLSTQVEKLIEHVPSPKKKPLQKLLADIHSLHRTLEISSDRAAKFDQIIHAWEKYH